ELLLSEKDYVVERPCPTHREHVRRRRIKSAQADVLGGGRLSDFVPSSTYDKIVVTEGFAERLKRSGLTGTQFLPLRIKVNQSLKPDPTLFVLQFAGDDCLRPLKLQGAPNACPHCGKAPLICPECGFRQSRCF